MITLASDFGSPYPAAMRGVILARSDARIVDVAHDLPRHDVRAAAFWLREVLPYFPPAVHCAVVDPGVGTDRDAVVVRVGEHALVAPDNGVALPVARRLAGVDPGTDLGAAGDVADAPPVAAFVVDDEDAASSTFHGRDVFAPAAARVHEAGVDALAGLDRLEPTDAASLVDCSLPEASVTDGAAEGEVLVVDDFGNVVTNVPGAFLDGVDEVTVDGERVPVGETFAAVAEGDRLVTVGSHGYVECDVNRGRGDAAFGLDPGDAVVIRRC
ncbi:SAM hydrolase/SAM-dependent halogenase family protein [Haloarchaeobius sp. HRN-SO-5]|uniref:SAM hydrolase/SAM-dependent halogenase family protein n=1 Tax=Haloarchaeobius sp. HRN-SO-5 TaxID=3446118 RepID=UPI003EC0CD18